MKLIFLFVTILYSSVAMGLNLEEALTHTYQYNHELKSALETLKAEDENKNRALGEFLPNAALSYQKTWNNDRQTSMSSGNSIPVINWNTDQKQFIVNQSLFNGGGSLANYKKIKNQLNSNYSIFLNNEQIILSAAINAYADVIESVQLVELSQKKIKAFREHYYSASERLKLGEATEFEVARAQAQLKRVESELIKNNGDYIANKASFQNITGLEAENLEIPDIEEFKQIFDLEELKTLATHSNPQLWGLRHKVEASRYEILKQASQFAPKADIQYSVSKSRNVGNNRLKDFDKAITLGVKIPIYQSGVEYANLKSSKKLHNADKYTLQKALNDISAEVIKSWYAHQVSISLIDSALATEKSAKIELESAKQEEEMQMNTISDVLDAEQDLYSAYVEYVKSCTNLMKAFYRVKAVTGNLTAKELGLAVASHINSKKRKYSEIIN